MAKSNAKSNKTAHVLNLLTEPGEARESSTANPKAAAVPAPSVEDNSEEVASAIHDALEEELLAELKEDEAAAETPASESAPGADEPEPAAEPEFEPFQPEPVAEEPAAEAPAAPPVKAAPTVEEPAVTPKPEPIREAKPEPTPAPQPKPAPTPAKEPDDDITYVNVMQALVEDRVDRYMKRYNMCTCHRCRTDVIALALTSLPPKYIVIPEHESVPMLSIYEGRYAAAVTAQILWACQKIAEHPRHTNNDDGSMRLGAPRK